MRIEYPGVEIINAVDRDKLYDTIEKAGRTCYKSENKITNGSAEKFIKGCIERGHEAVIEHGSVTLKFVCDRAVANEIVRHRLSSYCQESTRYCNYSNDKFNNEITVIWPLYLAKGSETATIWTNAMEASEKAYFDMLQCGCTAQEARSVLPCSLKTELVMTANMREWRHFLKLRTSLAAHPQMRQVANMALDILYTNYPALFDDIRKEVDENV